MLLIEVWILKISLLIYVAWKSNTYKILDDVRSARWFTVMADKCTDVSTLEQMCMCF